MNYNFICFGKVKNNPTIRCINCPDLIWCQYEKERIEKSIKENENEKSENK